MQRIVFVLMAMLIAAPISINAQEDKVVGKWLPAKGTSHVKIFKATNGKYYGKIIWLKTDPEKKDVNNPDEAKQNDPLLGLMLLKGFNYEAKKDRWVGGTIYDPDNGKTYDCYMWFDESSEILSIKGYVLGMKFIGRETQWKSVKE